MKKSLIATQKHSTKDVLRFAHPFVTDTPVSDRPVIPGVGTRMTDHIKNQLEPIPDPIRDPTMQLSEVIGDKGVTEIEAAGSIIIHSTGDTGTDDELMQQMVAKAMVGDYDASHPASSPAFFFHLGDVNYYENNDKGYQQQFYSPYRNYPGKIIAIPGNHDGELFKYDGSSVGQQVTLGAFMANFCQPVTGVPPAAQATYREMISQPGVYWHLDAPFVDLIGLYSNVAENPGYISAASIGFKQKAWLDATLLKISGQRAAGSKRALIIGVHHPPLSAGHHSGSTEMLDDIDDSCTKAGIMPTAVLAGHAHNIQTFTRLISFDGRDLKIPFVVCGGGGRRVQPVGAADGSISDTPTKLSSKHSFDNSAKDWGYLTLTITAHELTIAVFTVDSNGNKSPFATINTGI